MKGELNICDGESILTLIPSADVPITDDIENSIIIEKLNQCENENIVLVENKGIISKLISEYSAFGIILSNDSECVFNKSVSFLVRSQEMLKIEGEIVDSECIFNLPCLIDMKINKEDTEPLKYSFE